MNKKYVVRKLNDSKKFRLSCVYFSLHYFFFVLRRQHYSLRFCYKITISLVLSEQESSKDFSIFLLEEEVYKLDELGCQREKRPRASFASHG